MEKKLEAIIQTLNRVEVHGATNMKLLLDCLISLHEMATQIQQGNIKIVFEERGEADAVQGRRT